MKTPRKPLVFDLNRSPTTDDEITRVAATKPPAPKSIVPRQQLGTRIPVDVYKRLKILAVMEGVLVQDLLERAIVEFLERHKSVESVAG